MELPVLSFELDSDHEVHDTFDYSIAGVVLVVKFAGHEVDRFPWRTSFYWLDRDKNQVMAEAVKAWLASLAAGTVSAPTLEGWTWHAGDGRWIPMGER